LKDTPIGTLLLPAGAGYESIRERARQLGLTIADATKPPAGVQIVKGEWPGIRMTPGQGDASAGPTGAPWIDSNGWLIRLTRVLNPSCEVWVTADEPKANEVVPLSRHLISLADAAAHGGRWVMGIDQSWAGDLAARKPAALDGWKTLMSAAAFFEAHREWSDWRVDAVLTVVSSFSGGDEFFSRELLNLMARTNISYGIVKTAEFRPEELRGVRAVVYPDGAPAPAGVKRAVLDFVAQGGLLITGPKWGPVAGPPGGESPVPRYEIRRSGKGRIAMARTQPDDPYEVAQDAQILLSHRYDLVRFFNGFLLGSYSTVSRDGKRRMAHIVNYGGGADENDPATARIAGRCRSAKLWSLEKAEARPLEIAAQRGGVEVPLPGLAVYGGVELES
jgi:hypothetical protein